MPKPPERIYLKFNYPGAVPGSKTLLTGIRGIGEILYITGFYEPPTGSTVSFLYKGDITGNVDLCSYPRNFYNILNYPSSPGVTVVATNLYGPDILCYERDIVRVVGNYTTQETGMSTIGCMYEGPLDGSGTWTTLTPTDDTLNTIAHSTSGGLVVGNYDTQVNQSKAFIYDVTTGVYYNIEKPQALSITAYGIWFNDRGQCNDGGHDRENNKEWYTICGGYSNVDPASGIDAGYLVDWNNKTHELVNWRNYQYENNNIRALITHFDGITSDECGGYNLTGDAVVVTDPSNPSGEEIGFFANIKRHSDWKFTDAQWEEIKYPGSNSTSGNSVYQDTVIGVYTTTSSVEGTVNGYISLVI
ncbi:Hypothetical protein HVR_LOCUS99 [uncultured virus]|nr:Hypothetical protein HVR_LOCUS99 [uncultured virus]